MFPRILQAATFTKASVIVACQVRNLDCLAWTMLLGFLAGSGVFSSWPWRRRPDKICRAHACRAFQGSKLPLEGLHQGGIGASEVGILRCTGVIGLRHVEMRPIHFADALLRRRNLGSAPQPASKADRAQRWLLPAGCLPDPRLLMERARLGSCSANDVNI